MFAEFLHPTFKMPDFVYHYTDLNGLLGILRNKCLWATHYKYLNDSRELEYGENLVIEFFEENIHFKNEYNIYKRILNDIMRGKILKNEFPYITSFSKSNDNLPMWRHYSNGNGYCIKFKTFGLFGASSSNIVYSKDEQKLIIRLIIERERKNFENSLQEFIEKGMPESEALETAQTFFDMRILELNNLKLCFKDNAFRGEEEVRIFFDSRYEEKYRSDSFGVLIPYIEYELVDHLNPIVSIYLHPKLPDRAIFSLRSFCKSIGLKIAPEEITRIDLPIQ